ncbi:MAG: O-antigen ligase family protein [Chloroflexi bacterium]|nr:O-antigen ligase family protein [Chloroflexota bacterium]
MPVILWVLSTLVAVEVLENWAVAGLLVAVLGGIVVAGAAILQAQSLAPAKAHGGSLPLIRLSDWVATNELWILLFLSPLFLFPRPAFVPVFAAIPVLWMLRWRSKGRLTKPTPFDWPIVFLLVMLIVSLLASADPNASLPKFSGVLFGVSVFYAVLNRVQSEWDVMFLSIAIVVLGALIAIVGLLGTQWIASGKILPSELYLRLPRLITNIPGTAHGWIQPNEVGGSLAWVIPFSLVLLAESLTHRVDLTRPDEHSRVGFLLGRTSLSFIVVFTSVVLLITQSRSAMFGVALSIAAFLAVYSWRFRVTAMLATAGLGMFLIFALTRGMGIPNQVGSTMTGGSIGTLDLSGRQEVWEHATYAIRDFPFTGLGLNMFDPVTKLLYPYSRVGPDFQLTHAHDIYLQVAVDLGLPGLVAYIALLSAFAYIVCKLAITGASAYTRTVALAVGLGVLAHQIFGLTDAITLGAKPGILFWIMLGLAGGLWSLQQPRPKPLCEQSGQQFS